MRIPPDKVATWLYDYLKLRSPKKWVEYGFNPQFFECALNSGVRTIFGIAITVDKAGWSLRDKQNNLHFASGRKMYT
jgi:hypothetical protein